MGLGHYTLFNPILTGGGGDFFFLGHWKKNAIHETDPELKWKIFMPTFIWNELLAIRWPWWPETVGLKCPSPLSLYRVNIRELLLSFKPAYSFCWTRNVGKENVLSCFWSAIHHNVFNKSWGHNFSYSGLTCP